MNYYASSGWESLFCILDAGIMVFLIFFSFSTFSLLSLSFHLFHPVLFSRSTFIHLNCSIFNIVWVAFCCISLASRIFCISFRILLFGTPITFLLIFPCLLLLCAFFFSGEPASLVLLRKFSYSFHFHILVCSLSIFLLLFLGHSFRPPLYLLQWVP